MPHLYLLDRLVAGDVVIAIFLMLTVSFAIATINAIKHNQMYFKGFVIHGNKAKILSFYFLILNVIALLVLSFTPGG